VEISSGVKQETYYENMSINYSSLKQNSGSTMCISTDITDHEIDININILLVTHSWGPQVLSLSEIETIL